MKMPKLSMNTALGSVAIASGACWKFLSPKLLDLNIIAKNCIDQNLPKTEYGIFNCIISPIACYQNWSQRNALAIEKCTSQMANVSRVEMYSNIAIGALVISAGILVYRTAKAIINKINKTPSLWSQQKIVAQTGQDQIQIITKNYFLRFFHTSTKTQEAWLK